MMMHTTLYIGLIALIVGLFLFIWTLRNKKTSTTAAKVIGIIIIIIALLGLLCVGYYGMTYWHQGSKTPMGMMQDTSMSDMGNMNKDMKQGQ
jgi:Na+/proline symporter